MKILGSSLKSIEMADDRDLFRKKMEEIGIIKGSSLIVDWKKLGYTFTAYVGLLINNTSQIKFILERLKQIPNVTVAHVTSSWKNHNLVIDVANVIYNKFKSQNRSLKINGVI